jgi:phage-related minor tail protein
VIKRTVVEFTPQDLMVVLRKAGYELPGEAKLFQVPEVVDDTTTMFTVEWTERGPLGEAK